MKNNAQIEGGTRKGNILYAEKIPYMTKKFLNETDENMKKHFYCHCVWVREALKTGEVNVPSKFCKCSAGYYKNQWDVILDQTVEVEVLETILDVYLQYTSLKKLSNKQRRSNHVSVSFK